MFFSRRPLGTQGSLYQASFEHDDGSVPQMATVREYAENWRDMEPSGTGLLLWGGVGRGKTFAAACVANAVIRRGASVKMTTPGTILSKILSMPMEDKDYYLGSLRTCDLLILDDFGTERESGYAQEQLFGVIDGRYLNRKPMIVTTNLAMKEFKTPDGLAERRMFSRILERCVPVFFNGINLREQKAQETVEFFKQVTKGAGEE